MLLEFQTRVLKIPRNDFGERSVHDRQFAHGLLVRVAQVKTKVLQLRGLRVGKAQVVRRDNFKGMTDVSTYIKHPFCKHRNQQAGRRALRLQSGRLSEEVKKC